MDKEEVLAKSRAENGNRDVYEHEVILQASKCAVVVQFSLAAIFVVVELIFGKGLNWGLWALLFSANMTIAWVEFIKLHRTHKLMIALAYTVLVLMMPGSYIYNLAISSSIA